MSAFVEAAGPAPAAPAIPQGVARWLLILGVMLAVLLEIIDTSIVNVALSAMMGSLGATVDEISWVATSYIIANVIVIPMTSWLAGRFGRRRYFVGSILLFTGASFLCGAARTLPELVLFRTIQGLGGGALLAIGQSLMVEIFPGQRSSTGQAIFGLGTMLGPSLGPTLGGWITDRFAWPWIFYVNIPLGLAAASLCWAYLPRSAPGLLRRIERIDWPGIALLAVGLASLQVLLERGNSLDWFESGVVRALAATAALGLGAFVFHELRTPHPVVDLRVLRHRALIVGCTFGAALGLGLYGCLFLFPLFTQEVLGWTSWQAGLGVLPASIATAVTMMVSSRLVWRVGMMPLFGLGTLLFLPALWSMSLWTGESGWDDIFWPQVLRGVAVGFMFVPLSLVTLRSLPARDLLQGAGLYNLCRQLGGSLGIALLATLVDQQSAIHETHLAEKVSVFSEPARLRVESLAAGLAARGLDPAQAREGALELIGGILARQGAVLAFRDAFLAIFALFAVLAPFVLLMRAPRAPPAELPGRALG